MNLDIVFKQKYMWGISASDENEELFGSVLGVKVSNLVGAQSAFEPLRIRICCGYLEASDLDDILPQAKYIVLTRYDGCGMVVEDWNLRVEEIYDKKIEDENYTKKMDEDPDCPLVLFYHFTLRYEIENNKRHPNE